MYRHAKAPGDARLTYPSHAAVLVTRVLEKWPVAHPPKFHGALKNLRGAVAGPLSKSVVADKVRSLNSFRGRFLPGK